MGIYNCASTLVEALDSLYAQTYQDFKIILCEDGSSDNTYEVARQYAQQHDNIVLLRNERNMGLNYTLNRCLEKAQVLLDLPALARDGNYAFVCGKCASVFGYYGWFLYAEELRRRADEIYGRREP